MLDALSCLTCKERKVMDLLFGLEDGRPLLQEEVAVQLGVSKQAVSETKERAIEKIRRRVPVSP